MYIGKTERRRMLQKRVTYWAYEKRVGIAQVT